MLLRAEVWWFWHLLVCVLAYHIGFIPALDWILMFAYILGNYAYVCWIRAEFHSMRYCLFCVLISQLPIIGICAAAFCLLGKLYYLDAPIVLLQLSSSVFYPILILLPDRLLNTFQIYLWAAAGLLALQSLSMLIIACRLPKLNDPRNSYIEHDTIEIATKATRINKKDG